MKYERLLEILLTVLRCVFLFSFWITLIIMIILKAYFNFFTNMSWWWIFAPLIFSAVIFPLLFGFFIILEFIPTAKTKRKK